MSKANLSTESVSRRVALFRNGRNQAVRIPRDFEFQGDEVMVVKEGNRLVLEPIMKEPSLLEILASLEPLDVDFPNVDEGLVILDDIKL